MANIFMRIKNQKNALECLIYIFRAQMMLGKRNLCLTVKHSDDDIEYIKGNVDTVFASSLANGIEYGDLVLLEHSNARTISDYIYPIGEPNSLFGLSESMKNIDSCSNFIIPKGNASVYYIIKNKPMNKYTVFKNEIISDRMIGPRADIINNMCGRINFTQGIFNTLNI